MDRKMKACLLAIGSAYDPAALTLNGVWRHTPLSKRATRRALTRCVQAGLVGIDRGHLGSIVYVLTAGGKAALNDS